MDKGRVIGNARRLLHIMRHQHQGKMPLQAAEQRFNHPR